MRLLRVPLEDLRFSADRFHDALQVWEDAEAEGFYYAPLARSRVEAMAIVLAPIVGVADGLDVRAVSAALRGAVA